MDATSLLREKAALVQGFPLFSDISPSDCATIVSTAREKRFLRRETIVAEGDPVQQTWLLLSGWVKITQIGWNGNEVILRMNGSGEIIGAFGLLASATRTYCSTAQTTQPSTALVWDAANFESILGRFPIFHRNVTRVLQDRLQELEERFREVSTEKVGPRVSSQLLRLTKQLGRPIEGQVKISLSRAELAQLTGTTLFTVSRLLCQWQSLGIVGSHRRAVLVRDVQALMEMSQRE